MRVNRLSHLFFGNSMELFCKISENIIYCNECSYQQKVVVLNKTVSWIAVISTAETSPHIETLNVYISTIWGRGGGVRALSNNNVLSGGICKCFGASCTFARWKTGCNEIRSAVGVIDGSTVVTRYRLRNLNELKEKKDNRHHWCHACFLHYALKFTWNRTLIDKFAK